MKDSVTARFSGNMLFTTVVNGHELKIDASREGGGNNEGPRPKSLMMASLAGCTGMDVVSILRKMRVEFESFNVEVTGNITEEHPRHYDQMHVKYILSGHDIPREKVETAVSLSQEKYCGVSYSYKQAMKVTHEIVIIEK
ncbi:MAG: OsmC family protein [Bacteroidales bacterium]